MDVRIVRIMDGANKGPLETNVPTQFIHLLSWRLQFIYIYTHMLSLKKKYMYSSIIYTFILLLLYIKYYISKSTFIISFKLKNLSPTLYVLIFSHQFITFHYYIEIFVKHYHLKSFSFLWRKKSFSLSY